MQKHNSRGRRRILAAVALFVGALSLAHPGLAAVAEDEQWPSGHAAVPGLHGVEFDANSGQQDKVSVLFCSQSGGGDRLGTDVAKSPCSTTNGYSFRAVLGPCTTTRTVDCVESVTSTASGAAAVAGTFSRHFPAVGANDYTGSESAGVPDGLPPGIWSLPGAPHAFGNEYLVSAQITGMMSNGDALKPLRSFSASINPVSIYQTACDERYNGRCLDGYIEETSSSGSVNVKYGGVAKDQDDGYRCAGWGEGSKCALRHAFPAGVKYSLKVRLRTVPTGWLHGRMQDPNAAITTTGGVTTVTIEAEPTRVPNVSGFARWGDLPANLQDYWNRTCPPDCGGTRLTDPRYAAPEVRNSVLGSTPYSAKAFELLSVFRDFVKDKAAALPGFWMVRTLGYGEMTNAGTCIKDATGVSGIVSTNSTLYSEGPPSFNSTTRTLDYKVAAPHYEKDGTTAFKGRYNLMIRSDIARCIYKFSSAPIKSTIEVFEENGARSTAVTNVSETNNWLRLDASGFGFSAPTVKVALSQDATELAAAGTTSAVRANYTRTTIKGAKATLTINLSAKQTVKIYRKVGRKLTLIKTLSAKAGKTTFVTLYRKTYSFVVKDAKGKVIPPRVSSSVFRLGLITVR